MQGVDLEGTVDGLLEVLHGLGVTACGGVQLIMIGVLGEYIGKILSELKARPIYFVAEHSEKHFEADKAQHTSSQDTSSQDTSSQDTSSQDASNRTAAE